MGGGCFELDCHGLLKSSDLENPSMHLSYSQEFKRANSIQSRDPVLLFYYHREETQPEDRPKAYLRALGRIDCALAEC